MSRFVIVIGSQCQHLPSLSNVGDAAVQLLSAFAASTKGCASPLNHSASTVPGLVLNPSGDTLKLVVRESLQAAAEAKAILIIAWIGHGAFSEAAESYYLLPIDANPDDPSDGVGFDIFQIRQYIASLGNIGLEIGGLILCVDACESGEGISRLAKSLVGGFGERLPVALIAASTARESAFDASFSVSIASALHSGIKSAGEKIYSEDLRSFASENCLRQNPSIAVWNGGHAQQVLWVSKNIKRHVDSQASATQLPNLRDILPAVQEEFTALTLAYSGAVTNRIFLHYTGIHYLRQCGFPNRSEQIRLEMDLATRIALLGADTTFITTASYIESPLCYAVVTPFLELVNVGALCFVGGAPDLSSYLEPKPKQYAENQVQRIQYELVADSIPYTFVPGSSTTHLVAAWEGLLNSGQLGRLFNLFDAQRWSSLEEDWSRVVTRLEDRAFILDNVLGVMERDSIHGPVSYREMKLIESIVNKEYLQDWIDRLQAGIVSGLTHLRSQTYDLQGMGLNLPYKKILIELTKKASLKSRIMRLRGAEELLLMRSSEEWQQVLFDAVQAERVNKLLGGRFDG